MLKGKRSKEREDMTLTPIGQDGSMNLSYRNNFHLVNPYQNNIIGSNNYEANESYNDSFMKKRKIRNKFTSEEDQKLRGLIQKYGEHSWNLVSTLMGTRNQRQCRERWKHYLSCDISGITKPWTKEEDEIIINKYNELGAKWTKIARELPGRSDLQVKVRYLKFLKNKKNHNKHEDNESESSDEFFPDQDDDMRQNYNNTAVESNNSDIKNLQNQKQQDGEKENNNNQQESSIADTIPSETNYIIDNNSNLDFNFDFDLPPSNLLSEICQCDDNYLYQGFEPDILGWSFE